MPLCINLCQFIDFFMKSLMPGSALAQMEQCGKDVAISTSVFQF